MTTTSLSDLLQLSPAERIQLAQDLWDSIAAEPQVLPVSEAQRQEVVRRSEAHRRNPEEAVPLEDALERIDRSLA
ncbi:MAG TPA: addiction module protein [Longimicrobiaceae bacterium]|nr:addiction module protein [Longimicrobiaceae bacterium]